MLDKHMFTNAITSIKKGRIDSGNDKSIDNVIEKREINVNKK